MSPRVRRFSSILHLDRVHLRALIKPTIEPKARVGDEGSAPGSRPILDGTSMDQRFGPGSLPAGPLCPLRHSNIHAALLLVALALSGCDCDGNGLRDVRARLTIDPERIDFGAVSLGDLRLRVLRVANDGETSLAIDTFELESRSGEFALATPAPAQLGPFEVLDVNVAYEPHDLGEDTGSISIRGDGAQEGERIVALLGAGVVSAFNVDHDGARCAGDAGSVAFGRIRPGSSSTRVLVIEATGALPVEVLAIEREEGTSSEFSVAPLRGTRTIEPGERMTIEASYAPVDGGPDEGGIVVKTEIGTRRIGVCGEGVAPAICAAPVPLDFGAVAVPSMTTRPLRISSCGLEPLDLTSIAIAADRQHPSDAGFSLLLAPPLPRTLDPGDFVDAEIGFDATLFQPAGGWVYASSNALGNEDAFFPLSARGAMPCAIRALPDRVFFHDVAIGTTLDRSVLVMNEGASACDVTRIGIGSGAASFSLVASPSTPMQLGSQRHVELTVRYAPSAMGPETGTLDVEGGGAVQSVELNGNPVLESGCQLEVVPAFLSFGVVPPGSTRTLGVEVRNLSGSGCFIYAVALDPSSSPDLSDTSTNFGLVLPNAAKTLSVTYRPTAPGSATGTLRFSTSDGDTPDFAVPIFAESGDTGICVEPRLLPFGPTLGVSTMNFTIYACGSNDVTVTALDFTIGDPEVTLAAAPALPFTIASGGFEAVTVQYASMDSAGDYAVVTVRSDDRARPAVDVEITGGPEIVPATAGRYLYYWQIPSPLGGDIVRLPLQGLTVAEPYWGPRTGRTCTGCHAPSPDGRYVALMEEVGFKIIDTQVGLSLSLPPGTLVGATFFSWRPDVNASPPYQFAYDDGYVLHVAALFDGYLRELQGANDPAFLQMMPSWGADGKIAFVRGTPSMPQAMGDEPTWGFSGPTDIMVVDEGGGSAVPLAGASLNGAANYYPAHSPDAQWIAFTESPSAQSTIAAPDARIRLARADGSGIVVDLPQANGVDGASSYPTWSVDGRFLSFSSNRGGGHGGWDIYVAPIDPASGVDGAASNLQEANTPAFEHAARWSP